MGAVGGALLAPALQAALGLLDSPILKPYAARIKIDQNLRKLKPPLRKIQSVLNDAVAKQSDSSVKHWLDDVRDAAYDVGDLLDEINTLAFQSKQVTNRPSQAEDLLKKHDLDSKINEILVKLEDKAVEVDELGLKQGVTATWTEVRNMERSQTSLIDESDVFGRGKDKEEVIKLLLSDEKHGENVFDVIPIVGLGGLGKTTLAQCVFNDEGVKNHFDPKIWICVSDDFNTRLLTKSILEAIDKKSCDPMDLNVLQTTLREKLRGKKFLLVLDDVWSEEGECWKVLHLPFKVAAAGSKIIVTTRSDRVAQIMGTIRTYPLEVLSEEDCWLLFKRRAFVDGDEEANPELVMKGKEIVKKCKGLPLAAKTVGGLLHSKTDVYEWDMILQSEVWEWEEDQILPALRLSYNHLPAHLKQCFMFCSIFPKDHNFDKETLTLLWMAEGFVQRPCKGKRSLEDVASEYFRELQLRSFFQQLKTNLSKFVMHDLIHDLALYVAGETCFSLHGEKEKSMTEKVRHSSLLVNAYKSVDFDAFYETKGLRTMLLLSNRMSHENASVTLPDNLLTTLRRLRSWDMSYTAIKELPDSIGNLMHIRYLDLSNTHIIKLPESTCKLYNLQTLILIRCNKLIDLPEGTKDLVNLHHLNLTECWHLKSMPPQFGKLTSLQRLHRFVAGKKSGCGISELKNMNELRETLCIDRVEDVVSVTEAKEADLKKKQRIQQLVFRWSRSQSQPGGIDQEVLEYLEPHAHLKELKIDVYPGGRFPNWIGNSSLSHLEKIEFSHCNYCTNLPALGQLPSLKYLTIQMMSELGNIGREFYGEGKIKGFPKLEKLSLEEMANLKGWEEIDDGEFSALEELSISNCPKLSNLPKFPSVRKLLLDDCDDTILISLHFLTSLSSLRISNFRKTKLLPEGLLQCLDALEELKVQHFYYLEMLQGEVGLQDLPSINSLEVLCCPRLMTFPEEGLPSTLKHLSIGVCRSLKELPNGMHNLSLLEELNISKCPRFASFPEEKLPTSLKNIRISACANLESLPDGLHELSNLEHLSIESCQKLASLPDSGLPATLRQLSIRDCASLEKRCQEGGADWHKIKDIPNKWSKI